MARRMTKSGRQADETALASRNGGEAPARPSAGRDTWAPATNGTWPSEFRSRIEKLAYHLYQQRGCRHGDDWKDWLEAERLTVGETN
jgi:Protein of unknown function (DUF2934)